jgi:hypothetical protein
MPVWNGRKPVISNEFKPQPGNQAGMTHPGVDIMYKRLPDESAKLPEGTKGYFVPSDRIPVYAVASGIVTQSGKNPLGHSVIIDHGNGYSTFYQHLTAQGLPAKRVCRRYLLGLWDTTASRWIPTNHLISRESGRGRLRRPISLDSPSRLSSQCDADYIGGSDAIQRAIQQGVRDENRLTELVFGARTRNCKAGAGLTSDR